MRSALALRTSLVTAVVTGALLAPVAGTAFAATAETPAAASATTTDNSRYAGSPVYIGEGLVAVLRNKAEGPEAWIRAVGTDWKPGDAYMTRVMGLLNREATTATVNGLSLKLTKATTANPVLTVTKNGVTKSYALPKGETAPATCVSEVKKVQMGANVYADLTMSPKGPKAFVHTEPASGWSRTLDRTHPKGTDDYYLRIANPSGAKPVFEWKNQGGANVPVLTASFPALPKGCKLDYKVTEAGSGKPAPKPSTTPSASGEKKAQTTGQTTVVPQGPVAAGAELPVETVADTDNTTSAAAGAGLIAILAAIGATLMHRGRRNHG
ncbi:hypothetical protein OG625_14550 [Streptomyces sp. NBC_01351]|uniref:hypothetical protein n=1 Tax=Streptomyces sp. NBC_01351 TaxID=2903833 RepID=UPI002E33616E|nr:hypothetical protein [Streptomyces sp. NBC_01351]